MTVRSDDRIPASSPYTGALGRTRSKTAVYNCPCGYRYAMDVYLSIDMSARADLVQQLLDGNLNKGTCPYCGAFATVDARCILHDPARAVFMLYMPDVERHSELEARARLIDELAREPGEGLPDYVVDFTVIFGPEGLRQSLSQKARAQRERELEELRARVDAQARQVSQQAEEIAQHSQKVAQLEQDVQQRQARLREREQALALRDAEMEQRFQEVESLRVELERQASEIALRQSHVEEFARQLEKREKHLSTRELHTSAPGRFAAEVESPVPRSPSVFEQAVAQAVTPSPIAVSDEDVIEEAEIVEEAAIVEERPVAQAAPEPQPAPAAEPALEKAKKKPKEKPKESRKRSASRRPASQPRGLDDEAREALTGRERRYVRLDGDRVELFAVASEETMFRDPAHTSAGLRVHQIDDRTGYPWIVLSAAVRPPGARAHLFRWVLDYRVRVHRRIFGRLSEKCAAQITLTTAEFDREASLETSSRIEGNIKSIAADLERFFLDNPDIESPSPVDEGYIMGRLIEELKKPFPFHARYVDEHATLDGTVKALADLHEWSDPESVRRLVRIYSFPLEGIATIKRRVLTRAVGAGLDLPGALPEDAVSMGLADDVPALLMHSLGAFLTTCRTATDLSAEQITENWRRLVDAASRRDVALGLEISEMAHEYLCATDVAVPGAERVRELDLVPVAEQDEGVLLRWLHRPSLRARAALELLERGASEHLSSIGDAIERMAPQDLLVVAPRLAGLEEVGENFFLDGLKSDATLVRIGSALGLGKLKLRTALVPLINAMCDHDEPEWKVEALVISRYGTAALRTVEQFLRNPRGCEDRLTFLTGAMALAGCEEPVKEMGRDTDLTLASLSKKGFERRHQVQMELDALMKGEADDVAVLFARELDEKLNSR